MKSEKHFFLNYNKDKKQVTINVSFCKIAWHLVNDKFAIAFRF